jgi:heme peroxidase
MTAPATAAAPIRSAPGRHGQLRGLESAGRSDQFEGRFGRLFRHLHPAEFDETILGALAQVMIADPDPPTPEDQVDDEENTGISAGYTYLGQFIDHDLTFDPASSLQKQDDPESLTDFRTPRFDLDCVYGRGPDDQPYLYQNDGRHFLLGPALTGSTTDSNAKGLPRNNAASGDPARALIGDPRNDENVIVSQLQSSMLRFHNRMVDTMGASASFAEIQQQVRFHYQWVVLHDFLPTIVGQDTMIRIFGKTADGNINFAAKPNLEFYKPKKRPFMPVEFSVAAYRFGHSMVRPIYRLSQTIPRFPIFNLPGQGESLVGFRDFPHNWAIEWELFFNAGNNPPRTGQTRLQPAYKIDTSLVNPLGTLPASIAQAPFQSLAGRNLLRGWRMGLPSGQAVARHMGMTPIPDDKLKVGKANQDGATTNKSITTISPKFKNNAPLWFYVLAEAQQQFVTNDTPIHLGPVGGRIVAELFIGLMTGDGHSYLRQDPHFTPNPAFTNASGKFNMIDLLKAARAA